MGLGDTTTILFEDAEGNLVPVTASNPLPSTGTGGGGGPAAWGAITGTLSNQTDLDAALDGKLNVPAGTASGTTYARGDGTWATPPNTTYSTISQANVENPASTTAGLATGQRVAQAIAANTALVRSTDIDTIEVISQSEYDALPTPRNAAIGYWIV